MRFGRVPIPVARPSRGCRRAGRTCSPTARTPVSATPAGGHRLSRMPGAVRSAPPGLRRAAAANADPVHQAVPAEGERAKSPLRLQVVVDGTAVIAGQPGPARWGRRPSPRKQMMHRSVHGRRRSPSHFSGSLRLGTTATLAHIRPALRRTGPRIPPQGMCTDNSVIRSRSAASVALSFRSVIYPPFLATPPSGVHHLHASRAGSSPGAPCGGGAVAGTAGQVPEQPSARERFQDT